MNNKKYWSLQSLLRDSNLVRDIKTVVSFLLAYALAVISNGLIEEFTPASLISVAVGLGAIGTYFAIRIITNEFTERGTIDEEIENDDLKNKLQEQRELSQQIHATKAYDVLDKYNKDKYEELKKEKFNHQKYVLEESIKRISTQIENFNMRAIKFFDFVNKRAVSRLKKKLKKKKKQLDKLSLANTIVKYDPVELSHLRVSNYQKEEERFSEAQRYRITPQNKVRRRMNTTNFVKTFFFISFQGAVIAQIASWRDFLIFLGLMTLTLVSTAIVAYVSTRRYASMNYIHIIDEKIQKLKWLIEQQSLDTNQTVDLESKSKS